MVKTIIQRPGFCFWFLLTSAVGKEAASTGPHRLLSVQWRALHHHGDVRIKAVRSGKDFEPHIKSNK